MASSQLYENEAVFKINFMMLQIYFNPAIANIRKNNGENSVSDEHIQTVCRQILEEV